MQPAERRWFRYEILGYLLSMVQPGWDTGTILWVASCISSESLPDDLSPIAYQGA